MLSAFQVLKDIEEIYPEDETLSIKQHVDRCNELVLYIQDTVPDIQKTGKRVYSMGEHCMECE